MAGPSTSSGLSRAESRDGRQAPFAAPALALLTAVSIWLSAGTVAVTGGDTHRIAALPPLWILLALAAAALAAVYVAKLRIDDAWPLTLLLLLWLPFLPVRVPAAFLIWQGPIEAFVWLIVLVGLLATFRPVNVPQLLRDPERAPWIAGVLVSVLAAAAFSQVRSVAPGGDEPHYLAATQSVLKDFDLRVANNYANGDYLDYFPGRLEPHFLKRSTSGEIYSIHAPGVSFVILPAVALAGYAGAVVMMILIAAATAAITWRLAWRISSSVPGAWVGVAAVFLTAPYFFHTFTIYPEIIGSFCVMCGAWLLIELDDRDVSPRVLIAAGAALATLPWLHSRFAVLAGVLGLAVVVRLSARASATANIAKFLSIPAVAGASWFAFFWIIWGTPSPAAPYGADTSTSSAYVLRGLIGLLVDQQFGVLTTAPIYLMAAAGMLSLVRLRKRLAIELSLTVALYAIAVSAYAMWWAGSAAPARFLVAVLPLAALPIGASFRTGASPARFSLMTILLLVISIGLVVPRVLVEGGRFIFNGRGAFDATLEWLSQSVDVPLALPSVHRDGGSIAIRDAAIWIAVLIGAQAVIARFAARTLAVRWAVGSLALGIAAMAGASVVWSLRDAAIVTPDRAKLAALGALRPWHQVLVQIPGWRPTEEAAFLAGLAFDVRSPRQRVNRMPAGEFRISAAQSGGAVSMFVGRNDPPIEAPLADDLRDDRAGFRLRLPVRLQTLNFGSSGEAEADANWLRITPVSRWSPSVGRNATRAMRYGHARAFFFDDWAYPERDGIWTRANGTATIVIDTDADAKQAGLPISITAGAVATSVRLSSGEWEESLALAAGQKQELTLPPAGNGSWTLSIRSGDGFRPSDREPGNRDVRSLSAWIAIH
jgi:hypothetical protein